MTFKEELQALIYKHLPPTSTVKDYAPIAEVMHDEADRLDCESELFLFGWDESKALDELGDDNDDTAHLPKTTQAEAGIVPGTEYDWGEIEERRRRAWREAGITP